MFTRKKVRNFPVTFVMLELLFCVLDRFRFYRHLHKTYQYPAGNCMFKVNNRNTRPRCEICSMLTIKIPERRHWLLRLLFFIRLKSPTSLLIKRSWINAIFLYLKFQLCPYYCKHFFQLFLH